MEYSLDKMGGDDACWNWIGAISTGGYGVVGVAGKQARAHRVAYQLAHNSIPNGLFVCHKCDNRRCCNPSHLFLGTAAENNRDKIEKGRFTSPAFDEAHRAKLRAAWDLRRLKDKGNHKCAIANIGKPFSDQRRASLRAAWVKRRARDFPHLA